MNVATSEDGRLITIDSFDDGGLSSGPRKIQIYLPADYHLGVARYPVLYFSDGGAVFSANKPDMLVVDRVLDAMVDESKVVSAILVAIFNSNPGTAADGRLKDLSPFVDSGYRGRLAGISREGGGGLDGFYRMIVEVLKPYVDREFRTMPEPASTGIIGISLGGLAAFTMAYHHPETFGMAACVEASFWSANRATVKQVLSDQGKPKIPVRLWLDAGGPQYSTWCEVRSIYDALAARGWTPGDDLAAFFDYPAKHDWPWFAARIPYVLQFLLGKQGRHLIGHKLVQAVDPSAWQMNLGEHRRTIVGAEAYYSDGLRLNVPSPNLSADDPTIVVVDSLDPVVLHPGLPGTTMLRSTHGGFEASLRVESAGPFSSLQDRNLGMWTPFDPWKEVVKADGISAELLVRDDDGFVTMEIRVDDAKINVDPEKLPWEQSGVQIIVDPGPESELRKACGYDTWDIDRWLVINMSPSASGVPAAMESLGLRFQPGTSDWDIVMPAGSTATCALEPGGYRAVVKVPFDFLDRHQAGWWEVVRVNFAVFYMDGDGNPKSADWRPDWLSFTSPIGTGIYRRHAS